MPFDGTTFHDLNTGDTGIIPKWYRVRWRFWINSLQARQRREVEDVPDRRAAVIQLLGDAKVLIADEKQWVRGSYWRFPNKHCAVGALRSVARRLDDVTLAWSAHTLLIRIADRHCFSSVEAMNDYSSHAEVVRAFDEAIALARSSWR